MDKYQQSFQNMNGKIHILEQKIPIEEQMKYFNESRKWKRISNETPPSEAVCEEWFELVRSGSEDIWDEKDYILGLANSHQPKAYTYLKQLADTCQKPELKNWLYLALMDIQMSLESEMSEEKQIYVATGLGGKGNKLLFCILMFSRELKPFEPYQRQTIVREFSYIFEKDNCEVGNIEVNDLYVKVLLYIPFKANIRHAIDSAIISCNEYGNFLSVHYTITNVKELDEQEIQEAIEVYRKNENL